MKRSIIRKAGTVFLSTAAGFCLLSAEAGFAQDPRSFAQLPLEPPRPAIRQPAAEPPQFLEPTLRQAGALPTITPGSKKPPANSSAGVRSNPAQVVELPSPPDFSSRTSAGTAPSNNASPPLIVPRFIPPKPQTSLPVISPGPSGNPAFTQQPAGPEPVQLSSPVNQPPAAEDSLDDSFEMPILSVPTLTGISGKSDNPAGTPTSPSAVEKIGLDGYCPVTLRDGRSQVKGSKQHQSQWQGTVYRLATPQAKQRFEARPEYYAPAHGGLDVIKTAAEGQNVPGSLEHAVWFRRQLYLFHDAGTQKTFTSHPEKYAGK